MKQAVNYYIDFQYSLFYAPHCIEFCDDSRFVIRLFNAFYEKTSIELLFVVWIFLLRAQNKFIHYIGIRLCGEEIMPFSNIKLRFQRTIMRDSWVD